MNSIFTCFVLLGLLAFPLNLSWCHLWAGALRGTSDVVSPPGGCQQADAELRWGRLPPWTVGVDLVSLDLIVSQVSEVSPLAQRAGFLGVRCLCLLVVQSYRLLQCPAWRTWEIEGKPSGLITWFLQA